MPLAPRWWPPPCAALPERRNSREGAGGNGGSGCRCRAGGRNVPPGCPRGWGLSGAPRHGPSKTELRDERPGCYGTPGPPRPRATAPAPLPSSSPPLPWGARHGPPSPPRSQAGGCHWLRAAGAAGGARGRQSPSPPPRPGKPGTHRSAWPRSAAPCSHCRHSPRCGTRGNRPGRGSRARQAAGDPCCAALAQATETFPNRQQAAASPLTLDRANRVAEAARGQQRAQHTVSAWRQPGTHHHQHRHCPPATAGGSTSAAQPAAPPSPAAAGTPPGLCRLRDEGAEPLARHRLCHGARRAGSLQAPRRLLATVSSFFGEGSRSGDGGGWCQRHRYISVVER